MTSPVDTSVKFFSSLMANAPVYNGVAGAGIALLDACFKDGFDVKSVASLVVAGGVATVNWAGVHSAQRDAVILVSGVTGSLTALNGEQKVTSKPNATSCTFATAAADGTASGTISIKMAPLGWAKPFSGTNLAAYQSQNLASAKHLLRVDDTSTTLLRVVGYESMTDINSGLGAFPTAAQFSGGGYWPKRQAASATAVPWILVGDDRFFYFIVCPYGPGGSSFTFNSTTRGFGDPVVLKPSGDAYATVLNVSAQSGVASMQDGDFVNPTVSTTYMPRSFTGNGTGVSGYTAAYCGSTNASGLVATLGTFPNNIDGALYLSKKYTALSGDGTPRAELPGLRHIPQNGTGGQFVVGDLWPGVGADAGRNFLAIPSTNTSLSSAISTGVAGSTGVAMIDVTGPWR
jgi:hypothetical protein